MSNHDNMVAPEPVFAPNVLQRGHHIAVRQGLEKRHESAFLGLCQVQMPRFPGIDVHRHVRLLPAIVGNCHCLGHIIDAHALAAGLCISRVIHVHDAFQALEIAAVGSR